MVDSQGAADDLRRRVPRVSRLVRVIHNPVVWPGHSRQAAVGVDHPWLEDPEIPVILSVGRLAEVKDHATLLRALALVVTSRPARLVVLGEGAQRGELIRLAEELRVADRLF